MEWRIVEGHPSDVQKKLNQWKHQYHIHIHGFAVTVLPNRSPYHSVLLTREKKE